MQLGDFGYAGDDRTVPFQVDGLDVRGRIVQLGPVLERILSRHDYPDRVSELVAEAIVLVVLLGSSLKFEGRFVLQTKTDGPVSLVMADFTAPGSVRAYAKFDREKLQADPSVEANALLGKGVLALTVDQGEHARRYQGIVRLDESGLQEAVREYFRQSEQIPTEVRLGVAKQMQQGQAGGDGRWRAGGMLAQYLPDSSRSRPPVDLPSGNEAIDATLGALPEDGWTEALALMETLDRFELVDPTVGSERLLYRLFHERGVRVFDGADIADRCSCSYEKALAIVRSFSPEEIEEFTTEAGSIDVSCEFCSAEYVFDPAELEKVEN